ncbi:MAG: DNA mismatch endonuclease Vsr [Anaerolineales bacterium]|nr:DNA mismatch endonuclease Vsr [Anaerolineales bacterium]
MRLDPLTPEQRSERMSRIRNADTKPEMTVRRLVFSMGYRYRLHAKDLPGHPDLVFRSRKKVIFVHGCFWHQHGCNHYRMPKSKQDFWLPKLNKNVERDQRTYHTLKLMGWDYLVIWECQLTNMDSIGRIIKDFLG